MTISIDHYDAPGGTYYAYPRSESLADWTTNRLLLNEQASPNTGLYTADPNLALGEQWGVFSGASQPASWNEAVAFWKAPERPETITETILYCKIGATTQHKIDLGEFGSVVSGTPSAQLYIDNVATGTAYNLTGPSGTEYPLPITLADDATLKGKAARVTVTATVDGLERKWHVSSTAAVTNASSDISAGVASEVTQSLQGSVVVSEPVIDAGQISSDIVIGDDYLAAKGGRAFEWVVPSASGVTAGTAECFFGLNGGKKGSAVVEGTVTDEGDGTWKLSFDLPRTATQSLEPGEYSWSVAVHDTDGTEITRVRNRDDCYRVRLVEKQT